MSRPRTPTITVTDPLVGDTVTLAELAERYDLTRQCVSKRYNAGLRGERLIESIKDRERRSARASELRRQAGTRPTREFAPAPTPRELADAVLATREGRLASRLFRDYAAIERQQREAA